MPETPRRFQQIERAEERLTPLPEERAREEAAPRAEALSAEERATLGANVATELEANRTEVPPPLSLAEWKVVMERVRGELRRSDLTREEKRALLRDIAAARVRGGRLARLMSAAVGVVAALAAWWWLAGR